MSTLRSGFCLALAPLLAVACRKEPTHGTALVIHPVDAGTAPTTEKAPAGPVRAASLSFDLLVYFTPHPAMDPEAALDGPCVGAAKAFERIKGTAEFSDHPALPAFIARRTPRSITPPPDLERLKYFGVALTPEQASGVQASDDPLMIHFAAPAADAWKVLRTSSELAACLADATGGLVYDNASIQLFTPASWREKRLAGWKDGRSPIDRHFALHQYMNGEYGRAVTMGLGRFGLPDLVVNDWVHSDGHRVEQLVVLVAAALDEKATLGNDGWVEIEADDVDESKQTRRARFRLVTREPGEGDADNRLWEVTFEGFAGATVRERQSTAFKQLFGIEDRISRVEEDDAEMNAARNRARSRLDDVRARFRKGLGPSKRLLVKAPFAGPGEKSASEWMWVEVMAWNDEDIRGILVNQPYQIPGLMQGAEVRVSQKDLFDYTIKDADGTFEGNETSAIIERREKAQAH